MRLLFISEFFPNLSNPVISGGVETRAYYTAQHLAQNHQVTVLSRRRKGEKAFQEKGSLKIFRLGRPVDSSIASIFSLLDRLVFVFQSFVKGLSIQADLVEGSNYVTFFQAYFIGLIKKIPKLAWYPDVLIGQWQKYFGGFLGLFGEIGERISLFLPWDYYIAISQSTADKLVKNGVKKDKITVISCGVDQEMFSRKQPKFSNPTLVVVSRLLPYKHVDKVITALENLRNDFPKIKLVVIGEGPEKRKLERQMNDLGLEKQVRFLERLPKVRLIELLAKSHVLVHPSVIEGFGIVLVEAAAAGTPFVATDIPTSLMLSKSLGLGVIVKKRSPDEIVQAVEKLLEDKDFYLKKQKAGLINARKFSWKKLTDLTEKVYEKALS